MENKIWDDRSELEIRFQKLQKENENLKAIIAKELSENDEFGCEFVLTTILKAENEVLKTKFNKIKELVQEFAESGNIDFYNILNDSIEAIEDVK